LESEKQERHKTQKNYDFQDEQRYACSHSALARQRRQHPEDAKPKQKKINSHEDATE
jgi:hypothetical protein